MLVSELIKKLQDISNAYGDLPVSITISTEGNILSAEALFVEYDQRKSGDKPSSEIDIRNFPY